MPSLGATTSDSEFVALASPDLNDPSAREQVQRVHMTTLSREKTREVWHHYPDRVGRALRKHTMAMAHYGIDQFLEVDTSPPQRVVPDPFETLTLRRERQKPTERGVPS